MDNYFEFLKVAPVSKQAFSKAHLNLNPAYARKSADGIGEIAADNPDAPTWNGMRLIAIDGVDIALENSAELKRVFDCSGSKKDEATALGSLAYGPLDYAIYDCQIASYATDEREFWSNYIWSGFWSWAWVALLLSGRWYPSTAFLPSILRVSPRSARRRRTNKLQPITRTKT